MSHLTEILPQGWTSYGHGVVGAPALAGVPSNPDLELIEWTPPEHLLAIYRQHYGLGPWSSAWLPGALLPWSDVDSLLRHVRFGEENICWDPADCVLVCRDAVGGGWALQGRESPVWRWFDGTTHELGPPRTPWFVFGSLMVHW